MVWNVWKAEAGSRMKIEEEEDVMGDGCGSSADDCAPMVARAFSWCLVHIDNPITLSGCLRVEAALV